MTTLRFIGDHMKERTPAQRDADYRKSYPNGVNRRRVELLFKGRDILSEYEFTEFEYCNQILNQWYTSSPWWIERMQFIDDMGKRIDELAERSRRRNEGKPGAA